MSRVVWRCRYILWLHRNYAGYHGAQARGGKHTSTRILAAGAIVSSMHYEWTAPEHHERIFGLFNKLDVETEGTGVGLALVKRIIETRGGRIRVESAEMYGSTFLFTLPIQPPDYTPELFRIPLYNTLSSRGGLFYETRRQY